MTLCQHSIDNHDARATEKVYIHYFITTKSGKGVEHVFERIMHASRSPVLQHVGTYLYCTLELKLYQQGFCIICVKFIAKVSSALKMRIYGSARDAFHQLYHFSVFPLSCV